MNKQTLIFFNDNTKEIIEEYSNKIEGECICGIDITMVTESNVTNRRDGRRYYYKDDNSSCSLFRCKCGCVINENFKEK